MAAGAAAVQMLQTFGSFRHKDASRGPAHLLGDVTGLAQSDFQPRKTAAGTSRLHEGCFSHPFPLFNPGITRGHERVPVVLQGALPPGSPAIQDSRRCRFSGRVLRDPEHHEGTERSSSCWIFADEDAPLCPGCARCVRASPTFSDADAAARIKGSDPGRSGK